MRGGDIKANIINRNNNRQVFTGGGGAYFNWEVSEAVLYDVM